MIQARVRRIRFELDRAGANTAALDHAQYLVTDVTRMVLNRATVLTPVDTGNLRAQNQSRVRRRALSVVGEVFNNAKYAAAVHDGSGPHIIRARRGKALKFTVGGTTLYRRQVLHPGSRGRPWLARACREVASANGFTWTAG